MIVAISPAHPELSLALLETFVVELDGCVSHLPVRLNPMLFLTIRGAVGILNSDGSVRSQPKLCLSGPHFHPVQMEFKRGTLVICSQIRPGLLPQLLGLSPADIVDKVVDLHEIVDPNSVDQLFNEISEKQTVDDYIESFHSFLYQVLRHKNLSLIDAVMRGAAQKLFLPLIDFALLLGIGERQMERQARKKLGLSLRECRRIVRFGLALGRILKGPTERGDLTRIAHDEGYYDQAHMHREFIEWSGLSPTQIMQKIQKADPEYWLYRISFEQYTRICLPSEYLP